MSTANIVFKIDEVPKEFGFTLKKNKKITKSLSIFCKAFVVAFQVSSTSITVEYRQEYSLLLFLIIT